MPGGSSLLKNGNGDEGGERTEKAASVLCREQIESTFGSMEVHTCIDMDVYYYN